MVIFMEMSYNSQRSYNIQRSYNSHRSENSQRIENSQKSEIIKRSENSLRILKISTQLMRLGKIPTYSRFFLEDVPKGCKVSDIRTDIHVHNMHCI